MYEDLERKLIEVIIGAKKITIEGLSARDIGKWIKAVRNISLPFTPDLSKDKTKLCRLTTTFRRQVFFRPYHCQCRFAVVASTNRLLITNLPVVLRMAIVDYYFIMGEAVGIVATLFVSFYYSRKQMKKLSIDIETKILNDMDEKIHELTRMGVERPELIKVVNKVDGYQSADVAYAYHILYTFAHFYHMRQRGVVSDNEWTGWVRWIKNAFIHGTLKEIWEKNVEVEKWFDPAFQDFINKEVEIGNKK